MSHRLAAQPRFELDQLRVLIEQHEPLIQTSLETGPTDYELAALAAMLQSFYNGVENIFKRIMLDSGEAVPRGEYWHHDLLSSMAEPRSDRPAILSQTVCDRLKLYLSFRHVFRSAYVFVLRWDKMEPLIRDIESTLAQLQSDLRWLIDVP